MTIIKSFNKLQYEIIPHLTIGNDIICITPPDNEQLTSITLYRLYIVKAPSNILIIAIDYIHSNDIRDKFEQYGKYVPDSNVRYIISGGQQWRILELNYGRNIWVVTSGKAIDLCEMGGEKLTNNLVSVILCGTESLLGTMLIF